MANDLSLDEVAEQLQYLLNNQRRCKKNTYRASVTPAEMLEPQLIDLKFCTNEGNCTLECEPFTFNVVSNGLVYVTITHTIDSKLLPVNDLYSTIMIKYKGEHKCAYIRIGDFKEGSIRLYLTCDKNLKTVKSDRIEVMSFSVSWII